MPYADNQGVRIHYRVEGEGAPLVLHHGFTQSIENWYQFGYVDALKTDFRLILVDSRGHGASDKPHDPAAYSLKTRVGDVVAVLDTLSLARAHFWGYSMGGWIGFGMAQYEPDRVERLVIGGQHPYARVREALRQMVRTGIAGGTEAFIAAAEKMWGFTATPKVRDNLCSQDLEALLAMAEDTPGLEHVLPQMQMPCCIYSGEADPVCSEAQAASRLIPNARFFSLPGLTHAGAYQRSDLIVPKVGAFLRDPA